MPQLKILFLALMLALAACSSLPSTPKQSLAVSYKSVESVAEATYIAHRDGHITTHKRDDIRDTLESAMLRLDAARVIIDAGGDAHDRLIAVQAVLREIQKYLIRSAENE